MVLAVDALAPIPAHQLLIFLVQLTLLLVTARLLGAVARRMRMPGIVGELLAGVVLGPSIFANAFPALSEWVFPPAAEQQHLIDAVGQVGVLLLVGLAGMQLDLLGLRRRLNSAVKVSVAGLLIPLAIGVAFGFIAPVPLRPENISPTVFALFLGVAVCVSAVPVIAKTLIELKMTHRNVGQLILAAGMIDDAIGWFLLSIIAALAAGGLHFGVVATSLGALLLVTVFTVTIGRWTVHWVLRRAERTDDPTTVVATTVVLMLASSAATHALGLEAILGAFLCGVLIGSSGINLASLAPMNTVVMSVLAPIFFATAGLRMDLTALADPRLLTAALVVLVLAIAGKFAGAFVGGTLSGLSRRECTALGAGMNARGVIEVVIAMVGLRMGVIGVEAYTVLIVVAVVTSIMAPPILRQSMRHIGFTPEEVAREKRSLTMTE